MSNRAHYATGRRFECHNLETGQVTEIDGPLAEILEPYPEYQITALKPVIKEVERKIHHSCGAYFVPEKIVNLKPPRACVKRTKYQALMMGQCPRCNCPVFAWIAINHVDQAVEYFAIKARDQHEWFDRMLVEQRRTVVKLRAPGTHGVQDLGQSKQKMGTVSGTVRDKNSDKFRFQDTIRVE